MTLVKAPNKKLMFQKHTILNSLIVFSIHLACFDFQIFSYSMMCFTDDSYILYLKLFVENRRRILWALPP